MNHGDKRDLFSVLLFVTGGSFLLCGGILEKGGILGLLRYIYICLLYTSPSPRD